MASPWFLKRCITRRRHDDPRHILLEGCDLLGRLLCLPFGDRLEKGRNQFGIMCIANRKIANTCLNITIIKSSTIENIIRSYQFIHQPSFNTQKKYPKQENTTSSFASGVLFFSRSLRSFSWSVMVSSLGYVDQCCSNTLKINDSHESYNHM